MSIDSNFQLNNINDKEKKEGETAEKILDRFEKGTLGDKERQAIEKEIISIIRADLENREIAETGGNKKTSIYSCGGSGFVIKDTKDIELYILISFRKGTKGILSPFIRVEKLKVIIDGEERTFQKVILQEKANPLKNEFEKLFGSNIAIDDEKSLNDAKSLIKEFITLIKESWKRGIALGLDHFTEDFGKNDKGELLCFDPYMELGGEKPKLDEILDNLCRDISNKYENINSEFTQWAKTEIKKQLTEKELNKIWETEKNKKEKAVFMPTDIKEKVKEFIKKEMIN